VPYSFGWAITRTDSGDPIHTHRGSAGSFFAEIRLYPEQNLGIVLMSNAGDGRNYAAIIDQLVVSMAMRALC